MLCEICIFISLLCFGLLIHFVVESDKKVKAKIKQMYLRNMEEKRECFKTAVKMNKAYVKLVFDKAKTPDEFCDAMWRWLNEKND